MGKALRIGSGVLGLLLLVSGAYLGLVVAPPERDMGDVYRIIYAHVPAVWMAMLALTFNFCCSVAYLIKKSWVTDSLAEASAEVGLMFGAIGVGLGSIWAKPTWSVWWTWDPRLTTAAIMLVAYMGYLALRKFTDDADRRATWSAVVSIIAAVDLPVLYFSVVWWASIHQSQSSPKTIPDYWMKLALRWNGFAFLFLMIFFLWTRYLIAQADRAEEVALPPAEALPGAPA